MMNRRDMLRQMVATAAGILVPTSTLLTPSVAAASMDDFWVRDRTLWLKRAQTGEEFHVTFWTQNQIITDDYIRLCYILRDAEEQETVTIDVNLLNLLYGMQRWDALLTGRSKPIIVNSGYRTPSHNARLEGAARNSMHLYGRAADIRIQGRSTHEVAKMAGFFGFGGVGIYDTFTHVDTGRRRFWKG